MSIAITKSQTASFDLANSPSRYLWAGLCPILGAILGFMAMACVFIFERSTLFIAA